MHTNIPLFFTAFSLLTHQAFTLGHGDLTDDWEVAVRWTSAGSGWDSQEPLQQQVSTTFVSPTVTSLCPTYDGKDYVTKDSEYFRVRCSRRPSTSAIRTTKAASLKDCIDMCGEELKCRSVLYNYAIDECVLQSTGRDASDADKSSTTNYAFLVHPPTYPAKDEKLIACSTTCPYANGQSYESSYGNTFRINCGKRHATPYLETETYASFAQCMEACAADNRCSNVDYHEHRRTCYLSTHHGEPTVSAPGFSSAYSLGCSGACRGKHNVTHPAVPPPLPDTSCGNEGLEYAVYPAPYAGNGYKTFDPTPLKRSLPRLATGTTTRIGFHNSHAVGAVYGFTPPTGGANLSVSHRGYVYAKQTGTYVFRATQSDDVTLLWLGAKAAHGWTRANANLEQLWEGATAVPHAFNATLERGGYYPLRIVWANASGPGGFLFTITAPDGSLIVSDNSTLSSPYLVRYSCDGTTAPRFPPFGNET